MKGREEALTDPPPVITHDRFLCYIYQVQGSNSQCGKRGSGARHE